MENSLLDILDVIGTWVSSIGTVGAVITSLWIANSSNKAKLKVSATASYIIDTKSKDKPLVCLINILNIGKKPVTITCLGWEIGTGKKKKTFFQKTSDSILEEIPKTLMESQDLSIGINGNGNWLQNMANLLKDYDLKTMKLVVATNLGESFKAEVDQNLINEILKQQRKNGS